jgi:hypothetical protein
MLVDKLTDPAAMRERFLGLVRLMRPIESGHPLVRLGGPKDGGYLVPDDLDGIAFCFSPGVSDSCHDVSQSETAAS